MLNRIACVIVLMVGASLVVSCTAATDGTKVKIDAHTLLIELRDILEEILDSEAGSRATIKKIRGWQKAKLKLVEAQPKPAKYEFENQYHWEPQTSDPCLQACTEVHFSRSDEPHLKGGSCSLRMLMNLIGGDPNNSKGEAFVNMRRYTPVGERIPVNLRGKTVSAYIYAPWGAKGELNKLNGLQLFARDAKGKSQYGCWRNIRQAEWSKISLTVKPYNPNDKDRHTEREFDPTQIEVIGAKMATGDGSKKPYKDSIYVDDVNRE